MHGMAGSAALLAFAVSQVANPVYGVFYVMLFWIGSLTGMGALSIVIAAPVVASARFLRLANRSLQVLVGVVMIGIDVATIFTTATS